MLARQLVERDLFLLGLGSLQVEAMPVCAIFSRAVGVCNSWDTSGIFPTNEDPMKKTQTLGRG